MRVGPDRSKGEEIVTSEQYRYIYIIINIHCINVKEKKNVCIFITYIHT